jgi:outer membrane immunogenic protein
MRIFVASMTTVGVIVGLGVAAGAADLSPVYTKAPPPEGGYNWSGFYVGGNVGWGLDAVDTASFDPGTGSTNFTSHQAPGVLGGGQIGYNWMLNPSWLLGLETDFAAADMHAAPESCTSSGCSTNDGRTDAFGTARARIGFVQGGWLLYGTGGYAYAHSTNDRTIDLVTKSSLDALVGQSSSVSGWDGGWTAGGGMEWAFARNWSAKAEYLFADIDTSRTYTYDPAAGDRDNSSTHRYSIFRVGVNYHLWP